MNDVIYASVRFVKHEAIIIDDVFFHMSYIHTYHHSSIKSNLHIPYSEYRPYLKTSFSYQNDIKLTCH